MPKAMVRLGLYIEEDINEGLKILGKKEDKSVALLVREAVSKRYKKFFLELKEENERNKNNE